MNFAGIICKGKLKLEKLKVNIEINLKYYQGKVLNLTFTEKNSFFSFFPMPYKE